MTYKNNLKFYIRKIENNNPAFKLLKNGARAELFGIASPTFRNLSCQNIPAGKNVKHKIIPRLRELLNNSNLVEADVFPNDINTPQGVK